MLRNALLITTLLVSSTALSGCSSVWTKIGDMSYSMAEFTKPAALRGLSTKSEEDFAETIVPDNGVYKTAIGEYIPTEVSYDETGAAIFDTSPHPCPDGTYLNEENACMFLETETFEFEDSYVAELTGPVETGPLPCPDDTYLTAENTCSYLETETFDFGDDLAMNVSQPVETGPVPCPEETYLTADNTCSYLETETFDFGDDLVTQVALPVETGPMPCPDGTYLTAENTCSYLVTEEFDVALNSEDADTTVDIFEMAKEAEGAAPVADVSKEFTFNLPTECPEGFEKKGNNSCMYLGAELQIKEQP